MFTTHIQIKISEDTVMLTKAAEHEGLQRSVSQTNAVKSILTSLQ